MTTAAAVADHPRPWVDHYPAGIAWDVEIDTTPVHVQVLKRCAQQPGAVALDFLGKETSFGELGRLIEAFAGALQTQLGTKKGSRVALMLPNTPFYPVAYYGVLRTGATVVNCNPLYTVHELSHIVGNAGADIIVTLDLKQLFDKAEALAEAGHCKTVITCHFPNALPGIKKVLYSLLKRKDLANLKTSRIADRVVHFEDMIARGDAPSPVTIDPRVDVAVQQYTGGTTGVPKGAMLSHANIAANLSQINFWCAGLFSPPSKIVAVLPFFHIFAMTACMNTPLCNGATVVMLPRFELKAMLDLLIRTRPNVLLAVPTLIKVLSGAGDKAAPALGSVQFVISGGAPLPSETVAEFAKVSTARLVEGYGLTEASPVVACGAYAVPSKPMSIGQPLPATDLRFVDIDTLKPVSLGERGELQVKGPQVTLGYYDNEQATQDAFMDGWLRTGDVGYMDADGYLFLVDRIKDLIICSGFNVYPRNIEEALSEHPAVEENNVIGVPDQHRGETPVAFVKLRSGKSVTEEELKKFLAIKLNKLEMPKEIIFKDALPKTLIGKLSKKELREEYAQREKSNEPA
jgi:long-chain acyl-CoA synthetase